MTLEQKQARDLFWTAVEYNVRNGASYLDALTLALETTCKTFGDVMPPFTTEGATQTDRAGEQRSDDRVEAERKCCFCDKMILNSKWDSHLFWTHRYPVGDPTQVPPREA